MSTVVSDYKHGLYASTILGDYNHGLYTSTIVGDYNHGLYASMILCHFNHGPYTSTILSHCNHGPDTSTILSMTITMDPILLDHKFGTESVLWAANFWYKAQILIILYVKPLTIHRYKLNHQHLKYKHLHNISEE